jgi:hypothetical protein
LMLLLKIPYMRGYIEWLPLSNVVCTHLQLT